MNIFNNIIGSEPISALFYCFGVIIPTIALLFSYGNFAYRIGEYNLETKKLNVSLPIILILLLTKLFLISFVLFFIYHYIFDMETIYDNMVVSTKCFLWGLLIIVDAFLLNKELLLICNHVRTIEEFRKYLYNATKNLYHKYKAFFYIKVILIVMLIVMFVISMFTNNISFISLLLIIYVYYNFRINIYVNNLKKQYESDNDSTDNDSTDNDSTKQ